MIVKSSKRVFASFMCIAIILLSGFAFAANGIVLKNDIANIKEMTQTDFALYEDFDKEKANIQFSSPSKWVVSAGSGCDVRVVSAASGGKLEMQASKGCGKSDAYINTYQKGSDGIFYMSVSVTADIASGGDMYFSLRNADRNTSNSYDIFKIEKSGKIIYFGGNTDENGKSCATVSSIEEGQTKRISVLCNTESKYIAAYENGIKTAEISDTDRVLSDYKKPNFSNFYPRFYMSVTDEYRIYLDDIIMTELSEISSDVYFGEMSVQTGYTAYEKNIKNCAVFVNESKKTFESSVFSALYDRGKASHINAVNVCIGTGCDGVYTDRDETICNLLSNVRIFVFDKALRPLVYAMDYTDVCISNNEIISGEDILNLYNSSKSFKTHPRLAANIADFKNIKDNSVLDSKVKSFLSQADATAKKGADGIEYKLTNERLLSVSRDVKSRLEYLSGAYRLTNDDKYLEPAWKIIEKVCSFKDWHTGHLLDTTEMCAAVALAYDWLYDALSEEQRQIVENSLWDKALSYAFDSYKSGKEYWMRETVNRNIVNNGGFVIAASALLDCEKYSEQCAYIIGNGIYYIGYMLPSFAPDGAWDEGVEYLVYTIDYLAKTSSVLYSVFGGDFGIAESGGISGVNNFLFASSGIGGRYNFHDDSSLVPAAVSPMLYLAKLYDKPSEAIECERLMEKNKKKASIYDLLWHTNTDTPLDLPLDSYFIATEFVSMRDKYGDDAKSYLAFHGGITNNGDGHYHVDAGSFVLDLNGVRWGVELGSDSVTYSYFSNNKRKTVYRVRAEGHNTLVINPNDSKSAETLGGGQASDTNAKVISINSNGDDGCTAVLDLSGAYPTYCKSVQRAYSLFDKRKSASITDEVILKEKSDIYWFMHMPKCDYTSNPDGSMTFTQNGKSINVSVSYAKENASDAKADISLVGAEKLQYSPATAETDTQTAAVEADNGKFSKLVIKISGAPIGKNNLKVVFKAI